MSEVEPNMCMYIYIYYIILYYIILYYIILYYIKHGKNQSNKETRQNKINPKENAGARGPTVAKRRSTRGQVEGTDVIFFLYLSIIFCLGFPILPYAPSFYWHFLLRPLHFILFFKVPHPPPWQQTRVIVPNG